MRNQQSFVVYYLLHFSMSKNSWSLMPVLIVTLVFHEEGLISKILKWSQVVIRMVLNGRQYGECTSL